MAVIRIPSASRFHPTTSRGKNKMLDNIIENLELIEPHQAFFTLKN